MRHHPILHVQSFYENETAVSTVLLIEGYVSSVFLVLICEDNDKAICPSFPSISYWGFGICISSSSSSSVKHIAQILTTLPLNMSLSSLFVVDLLASNNHCPHTIGQTFLANP